MIGLPPEGGVCQLAEHLAEGLAEPCYNSKPLSDKHYRKIATAPLPTPRACTPVSVTALGKFGDVQGGQLQWQPCSKVATLPLVVSC